jgi:hypothetical protein
LHLIFEDGFCHPTECGADILETFEHPKITIGVEGCDMACLIFILFVAESTQRNNLTMSLFRTLLQNLSPC